MLVLVSSSSKRTTTSKHTQVQLFLLDCTGLDLVSLPQVRCVSNYMYVENLQKFGPEIVCKSRGLFRALGYNELVIYRYRG